NGLNKLCEESPELAGQPAYADAVETLLLLLAPMAPHTTEELWQERRAGAGAFTSVHQQPWPTFDPALTVDDIIIVVVQVNGKVRDKLEVAPDIAEDEVRRLALASVKVQAAMEGRPLKKFIYVKGRLASVVA